MVIGLAIIFALESMGEFLTLPDMWFQLIAGPMFLGSLTYLAQLLIIPFRRQVFGNSFRFPRLVSATFLVSVAWYFPVYVIVQLSDPFPYDSLLPETINIAALVLGALLLFLLNWSLFKLSYRLRPAKPIQSVFE